MAAGSSIGAMGIDRRSEKGNAMSEVRAYWLKGQQWNAVAHVYETAPKNGLIAMVALEQHRYWAWG